MSFRVSDHEFKIMNGIFISPQKCQCECGNISDVIMIECYHIYICHKCITGYKEKKCEKCKVQFKSYEKVYIEPFV